MADFVTRAVQRLREDPRFSRNRYFLALSSPEGRRALRIHRHLRSLERDLAAGSAATVARDAERVRLTLSGPARVADGLAHPRRVPAPLREPGGARGARRRRPGGGLTMLEFDPLLLTGVDEIDAQHRELFRPDRRAARGVAEPAQPRGGRPPPRVPRRATSSSTSPARSGRWQAAGYPKLEAHRWSTGSS